MCPQKTKVLFLTTIFLLTPCKTTTTWSGKMLKRKKKLIEIQNKLIVLEKRIENLEFKKTADPVDEISYKEVVDEWLNGKTAKQI